MKKTSTPLENLYPFLHGKQKPSQSDRDSLLISIQQKAANSVQVSQQFFKDNANEVIATSRAIANVYIKNGRMLTMGNGGSSCDASHFAVEFLHPVTTGRPALPALNLVMDTAMLSAVGNDIGMKHIYARQLDAHANKLDGLIGFSTSGNSENLITAFEKAKNMDMVTFGLTGGNGGEMWTSGLVDHCLVVDTDSIHRVQEVHVATYHIIWDLVHTLLADHRGSLTTNLKEVDDL